MKTQTTNEAIESVKNGNISDYTKIYLFSLEWVKNQFKSFTTENLKNDYYKAVNDEPIEPRVYGAVIRNLSKDGLIFKQGFEQSKNKICHSRPQQIWYSLEMKKKQAQNASNKTNLKLEL